MQRVHLDIHVGEQTMDYAGIAQKEKLTELQLRVRQLLAQVEQINKEQNYQRVSVDSWYLVVICKMDCILILKQKVNFLLLLNYIIVDSRGTIQANEWEHQPTRLVVVIDANCYPFGYGRLANETLEEVFRSQKTRLEEKQISISSICLCSHFHMLFG